MIENPTPRMATTPTAATATIKRASTTPLLLRILIDEISRDGGACLVTSLKDYIVAGHSKLSLLSSSSSIQSSSKCIKNTKKNKSQILNSLLIGSNIGKPRLLAFLESHPDIFNVDRTVIPHWVKLVVQVQVQHKKQDVDKDEDKDGEDEDEHEIRVRVYQKALYVLRKRQAKIDRRTQKSIDKNGNYNPAAACDDDDNGYDTENNNSVNTHWLLNQCCWNFHYYLRTSNFYINPILSGYDTPNDVKQVGSREWEDITLETFEQILLCPNNKNNKDKNSSTNTNTIANQIHVQDGRAYLKQQQRSDDDKNYYSNQLLEEGNNNKNVNDVVDDIKDDQNNNHYDNDNDNYEASAANLSLMRQIDKTLTDIICEKDGGHQISLQLLLHRYPYVKEILGGRDLWKLYQKYSTIPLYHHDNNSDNNNNNNHNHNDSNRTFFEAIIIFHVGPNLILRTKLQKTNRNIIVSDYDGDDDVDIDDDRNKDNHEERRMKVDEVGLYSVTSTKWGRAISNLMIQACQKTNLFEDRATSSNNSDKSLNHLTNSLPLEEEEEEEGGGEDGEDEERERKSASSSSSSGQSLRHTRMVIDLTASVGGMTLELARTNSFDRVLAFEIDKGRAALCKDNMKRHGFYNNKDNGVGHSIVEIRNEDSVQQIPFLPRRVCIVIDPPWGGYNYKQQVRRAQKEGGPVLKLGDAPLEDVLALIACHNSPCVVGLRLPINFIVQNLLNALTEKDEGIHFECITRRKISVQLFVILYFPSVESSNN
mgnify:CR=1 FL=1